MTCELIAMNLLNARVCSDGTWDETLDWIRREHPSGTTNNWSKNELEKAAPIPCADNPKRTHYMFIC